MAFKWHSLPLVVCAVAALPLSSCDQRKTTEHQVAAATPASTKAPAAAPPVTANPNAPLTDAEFLSAFMGYWQQDGARLAQNMVTPIGAQQLDNAVTQNTPYGKQGSVSVSYSFRANVELTYLCGGYDRALSLSPAPNLPSNSYAYSAHPGDTFRCVLPITFSKIDQGWSVHLIQMDTRSYIIRR
jgi:hypothetical protein